MVPRYMLPRHYLSVILTYEARKIGNIPIWLKEWNYSGKRDSQYSIYTYNLK